MGLFDSISSFFSSSSQQQALARVKDIYNPLGDSISFVNPVTGHATSLPGAKAVVTGVEALSVAAAGALIAPGATAATIETVGTAASQLSPKTKVAVGAGTALFGAGIVTSAARDPDAAVRSIAQIPVSTNTFSKNVTDFASDPSLAGGKKIYTDTPVVAGIATIGAGSLLLGGLGAAASTWATVANTKSVNANTVATQTGGSAATGGATLSPPSPTNGHDEDIAKVQARNAADIAKTQADAQVKIAQIGAASNRDTLNAQFKALQLQTAAAASTTPVGSPASSSKKKKKTKKKTKKKKAQKRKAKRKTYKRKAPGRR